MIDCIITGLSITADIGIILILLTIILVIIVIVIAELADSPIGRIAKIINNQNHNLDPERVSKVKWWFLLNHKKIKELDKYLSTGMTASDAYHKVILAWRVKRRTKKY